VNTDGSGYAVLKSFTGSDGASPRAGLVLAGSTLYGTTLFGGDFNHGVVFNLSIGTLQPLAIVTTSPLPKTEAGVPYSLTFRASGGAAPYTWSASGDVPPGLSLGTNSGTLSGRATNAGTFNFRVRVNGGTSVEKDFTLSVLPALAIITPAQLPDAMVGQPYSQTLLATGGVPPYAWSKVGGALPPGLRLSAQGSLNGKPAASGDFTFRAKVMDRGTPPQAVTNEFDICVHPARLLISTASPLPPVKAGVLYKQTLLAANGKAPYTWQGLNLPPGLLLSTNGLLSGVPTQPGTNLVLVSVTDAAKPQPQTATGSLALVILPGELKIITSTLPNGKVGVPYQTNLTAVGGTAPYTWTNMTALPGGLALTADGRLSGTPSAYGSFKPKVKVTDHGSPAKSATGTVSLKVDPEALRMVTGGVLPPAEQGVQYSQALTATGGIPPYTWTKLSGSLPNGVSLQASGAMTGKPASTGTFSFRAKVTDRSAPPQALTNEFVLSVTPSHSLAGMNWELTYSNALAAPDTRWIVFVDNSSGAFVLKDQRWEGRSLTYSYQQADTNTASLRLTSADGVEDLSLVFADSNGGTFAGVAPGGAGGYHAVKGAFVIVSRQAKYAPANLAGSVLELRDNNPDFVEAYIDTLGFISTSLAIRPRVAPLDYLKYTYSHTDNTMRVVFTGKNTTLDFAFASTIKGYFQGTYFDSGSVEGYFQISHQQAMLALEPGQHGLAEPEGAPDLCTPARPVLAVLGRPDATGLRLSLAGQPGSQYVVEVSSDLAHWKPLTRVRCGQVPVLLSDPGAAAEPRRYYRAVPQP